MSRTAKPSTKPKGNAPLAEEPRRRTWRPKRVFFITVGAVVAVAIAATAYAFEYRDSYLPHSTVGGVKLGGLTRAEAEHALTERRTAFMGTAFTLRFAEASWEITPEALGTQVSFTDQLEHLWQAQKTGTWWEQLGTLFSALVTSRSLAPSVTAMGSPGEEYLKEQVLPNIETAFKETSLALTLDSVTVVPGVPGERLNRKRLELDIAAAFASGEQTLILELEPSSPEVSVLQAEPARRRAEELLQQPLTLTLGTQQIVITREQLVEWLATEVSRDAEGSAHGLTLVFNSKVNEALTSWIQAVDRAPVHARLGIKDGVVVVTAPDTDGKIVNRGETLKAIYSYFASDRTDGKVKGVIEVSKAAVRADTLAALGLKELVGTATTDFTGSPNNRKFNITKGAQALDRQLIQAGATFSTTSTLGPVEESTGYLPELVIKGNRTVPEAGGGLCQVSTTLFRAVLNAGLPILERQNHAYRVSYYERDVGPGLDATVYIPNPDLKWKNDFGSAVFVQSSVKENKITFEIFGTKDGRVSAISSPTILETYPVGAPIYIETDTLFKGETRQIEKPHDGAKTSVSYSVTRDGKEIYKRTFISVYRVWPAQYLVGTKEPAAAVPAPEPAA